MNIRQAAKQHVHTVVALAGTIWLVGACSSFEPVYVPEGTLVDTPATITVEIDREIELKGNETKKASVVVSKIGDFEVSDTRMYVDVRLDPILKIARLQGWQLEFKARDDKVSKPIDGFLVDASGKSELEVVCEKPRSKKKAPADCNKATLMPLDNPLTTILLEPLELGGITLMGKT